jgi:hypothetical protein
VLKYHIQTIEVGSGGAAEITFNSIPQDYDDLLVEFSLRSVFSAGTRSGGIRANGIGSGNVYRTLTGNGSSPSSFSSTSASDIFIGEIPAASATASTFGNGSVIIPNYTTTGTKTCSANHVSENNATAAFQQITAGTFNTTSPITSITVGEFSLAANVAQHSSASLYGIKRGSDGKTETASGGLISYSGGYTIHTFQSSGTFVANRDLQADVLVVAGGGSGGPANAGGGGAGGYLAQSLLIAPGSYSTVIGAGGAVASGQPNPGTSSSFLSALAIGGGRGGDGSNTYPPGIGGSGGGGGGQSAANTPGASGTSGQGFGGGASSPYLGNGFNGAGGGGGGATTAGGNSGGNGGVAGVGGAGAEWLNGSYYAGGGGGGANNTNSITRGLGGIGGGGNGGPGTGGVGALNGEAGAVNTGGGGGGGGGQSGVANGNGGNGGSGVVIIRYLTPA